MDKDILVAGLWDTYIHMHPDLVLFANVSDS